jgi:alpha-ketoglutarate-dependent taurine dioxygenase|tara:strand:+ start:6658 stop:7635 length:978 start_codon:yes stop_codon:yes gene_type:complete
MSLINVEKISVADQQHYPDSLFPLVYASQSNTDSNVVARWIQQYKSKIEAELEINGAVLFRGFGVVDDQGFDAFIRAFDWPSFTYEESLSNAVRHNRTELVFTANEAPPSVSIFLHHEMAQTPVFPSKLFFFCEQAAASGGATPICRSDVLLERLQSEIPSFVAACEQKGIRYSQTMPAENDLQSGQGRSWASTLSAANAEEAETKLERLNYQWQWQTDGSLSVTTPILPAIKILRDGRKVFFNQLIAAFRGWQDARNNSEKSICYGDDSLISNDDMAVVIRLADQLTFDISWQAGDVVLVDNFITMHGRRPFEGQRSVLASLVA